MDIISYHDSNIKLGLRLKIGKSFNCEASDDKKAYSNH